MEWFPIDLSPPFPLLRVCDSSKVALRDERLDAIAAAVQQSRCANTGARAFAVIKGGGGG